MTAEVCIVVGSVTFGAAQSAFIPPAPVGGPYPGNPATNYSFVGVNFICAGVNAGTGVCNATSNGTTDPANPAAGEASGGFAGTYTNTCDLGGCAGDVGGPTNNMNPPSPGPGTAPWSWTSGPLITGYIDCGAALTVEIGVVALVAAPDLLDPNTKVIINPPPGAYVQILYTKIIVVGVAVFISVL